MAASALSRNRGLIFFIFSLLSLVYVANSLSNKEFLVNILASFVIWPIHVYLSLQVTTSSLMVGFFFYSVRDVCMWCCEATDTLTTSFCKFQKLKEQLRKLEERAARMKVSLSVSCWSHVVSQMWTWNYIPQQNIN